MEPKQEELITLLHSGVLTKLKIKTSTEIIEEMEEEALLRLWNMYETRYAGCIADAAINSLIELYLMGLTYFYPDRDKEAIRTDLKADVILNLEAKKHLGRFISPSMLSLVNVVSTSLRHTNSLDSYVKSPPHDAGHRCLQQHQNQEEECIRKQEHNHLQLDKKENPAISNS